ncbi:hypothetical protein BO86DRAFT_159903 [Aspergillus japonicus CBS 114.51]|uniref:Uncharacterized protein n=1 Tax=Aspergillus japonicus CBS 114.51 TaxID=1448312 RepID=A0A8T8XBZ8_ASPJA|nr:hypothetical protein BO86DRAFT_159903 [Aspergillus japonicus CBS 114.51]RAH85530.1 hypothetical protein BO86DRAFT_159903 [Aspergillus japonicus CBS 114.51]
MPVVAAAYHVTGLPGCAGSHPPKNRRNWTLCVSCAALDFGKREISWHGLYSSEKSAVIFGIFRGPRGRPNQCTICPKENILQNVKAYENM